MERVVGSAKALGTVNDLQSHSSHVLVSSDQIRGDYYVTSASICSYILDQIRLYGSLGGKDEFVNICILGKKLETYLKLFVLSIGDEGLTTGYQPKP